MTALRLLTTAVIALTLVYVSAFPIMMAVGGFDPVAPKIAPATWSLVMVTGDEEEDRARKPTASDLTHERCVKFLFAIFDDPHRELNFRCRKEQP